MDYCDRINDEAGSLRNAAATAGPEEPIPTCPGWTMSRLISHMVRVYGMVITSIRDADPAKVPERTARPPEDWQELLDNFDTRGAELLTLLRGTDPDAPAWNFSPTAPKTVAFFLRRMAHETAIHGLDAQAAIGKDADFTPEFAADGIDEVLTRLIQRATDKWVNAHFTGTVRYHAADAGRAWTTRLVPGQLPQTAPESVADPSASVVGLASALYRCAWGRPSNAVISGSEELVAATRAS